MPLSQKQLDYIENACHRWNVKTGAVRSGKTYGDFFMIPKRLREPRRAASGGLVLLAGATSATVCRNILDPMRELWGETLVGRPSPDGAVTLFGERCAVIGAGNTGQTAKIQGASVKYCYGDEVTVWRPEFFDMLKSRLDRDCSVFDGTCNPGAPGHWFKKFLDSDADVYVQAYTIDDNPYLPPDFVASLKAEYAGSVWYDRFILGRWVAAEGAVYRRFADDTDAFILPTERIPAPDRISVGVDFGGNKSATAFVAVGASGCEPCYTVLDAERHSDAADSDSLALRFCAFCARLERYGLAVAAYCDNAEPVLIRTLKEAARKYCPFVTVRPALKLPINDRIRFTLRLMSSGRFKLTRDASTVITALNDARWSDTAQKDIRLDDGSSDIDTLDALEYALERDLKR